MKSHPKRTWLSQTFPIEQLLVNPKTEQRVFTYTPDNTPLQIGQQLTYALDKELTNRHRIDHTFWVNKIQVLQIGALTNLYGSAKKGHPNALYVIEHRPTPAATIVVTLTLVTGTGLLIYHMMQNMFNGFTL